MFCIKRTLTILFIVAFIQAFSQESLNEKLRTNNNADAAYMVSSDDGKTVNQKERLEDYSSQSKSETGNLTRESESEVLMEDKNAVQIEFLAPGTGAKFKRGKMIQLRWTGGRPDDEYALDLFNGRFHYRHIGELKNSGIYPWIIPVDVEPGKEYKFKLTNTEDFGEYAFSNTFIIKRKTSVAAWIVPGALVVGGGLFLIFYDNSPYELPDLPWPIDPN
jgi:hypothetical protein